MPEHEHAWIPTGAHEGGPIACYEFPPAFHVDVPRLPAEFARKLVARLAAAPVEERAGLLANFGSSGGSSEFAENIEVERGTGGSGEVAFEGWLATHLRWQGP